MSRLLAPRSIAVIGGGVWCANIFDAANRIGYSGEIFPVHPRKDEFAGQRAYPSISALPCALDAAFIGVNRKASIQVMEELCACNAGGAIAFASGFTEASDDDAQAASLQRDLICAAQDMPFLGPNCYGFVNALDQVALWPDQHGCRPVESGVAIVTQSSNLAINLSMQRRGLPIGYLITLGNQARLDLAQICAFLAADPRVTAIGLHIEGFSDLPAFEAVVHQTDKPIVALKIGASSQAQSAAITHTASMAGSHVGAKAFLARLGIAQVADMETFVETLKILHVNGPLPNRSITSMSCSGGEAGLIADAGLAEGLEFPPINAKSAKALTQILGPRVSLANPLDYHTYIWGDVPKMAEVFASMGNAEAALNLLVLDLPREDISDPAAWDCALDAIAIAHQNCDARFGLISSFPENLPEPVAARLMNQGIVPLSGIGAGLSAIRAAASCSPNKTAPQVLLAAPPQTARTALEPEAKAALTKYMNISPWVVANDVQTAEAFLRSNDGPFVLKAIGEAHKSETGGVHLNLEPEEVHSILTSAPKPMLLETMTTDGIVELIVSVVRDPVHGFVLTIGAGGTLTELMADTAHLLVPASDEDVNNALDTLKIAPLLDGYRGKPAIDRAALRQAIAGLQNFVTRHAPSIEEVEINPLICTAHSAIVADALLRMDLRQETDL